MAASCITFWCCCFYHCLVASASLSEWRIINDSAVFDKCTLGVPSSFFYMFVYLVYKMYREWVPLGQALLAACRVHYISFPFTSPGYHQQPKNFPEHKFNKAQQLSSFVSSDVINNKIQLSKAYLTWKPRGWDMKVLKYTLGLILNTQTIQIFNKM